MPSLLTPHALHQKTPEPHSTITVTNLSTHLPLARDAWGRPSKSQPLLISCTLSLRHPFSSASSSDSVTNSTIHYGILSKKLLEGCEEFRDLCQDGREGKGLNVPMHLRALVCYLQYYLTGGDILPRIPSNLSLEINSASMSKSARKGVKMREPVVACEMLSSLSLEILLPKASLLGSGVSLLGAFLYEEGQLGPSAYSMVLRLRDLRVPCVVGINDNERRAKQVVVCGVEMERWDRMVDVYPQLEEIVVKTIEESSFQTLEALAAHLADHIFKYFLLQHYPKELPHPTWNFQRIRIKLSKPTAVTFADAPTVEMLVDTDPAFNMGLLDAYEHRSETQVPFPLEGKLDDWIREKIFGTDL